MKGKILFEEQQSFRYTWAYWLVVACTVPFSLGSMYGIYQQIVLGEHFGDKPMSDLGLIIFTLVLVLFTVGLIGFLHSTMLRTIIDQNSLSHSFFPFKRKVRRVTMHEIESIKVRKYGPLKEFGGWGYRTSLANGKAYNVKGNKGLQITFKNNKRLLLGTQKPDELIEAVETLQENWRSQHG